MISEKFIINYLNKKFNTEIEANQILDDIDQWDSLEYILLIYEIENNFKIRITNIEFENKLTIEKIIKGIRYE